MSSLSPYVGTETGVLKEQGDQIDFPKYQKHFEVDLLYEEVISSQSRDSGDAAQEGSILLNGQR